VADYCARTIYNSLIVLSSLFGGSLGWAVIGITFLVKFILLPFSLKTHRSQILQKKLQPEITKIKKQFPDQVEQSKKIMELYKQSGSNPFAGCLPTLIQLPILIGMYQVFFKGISQIETDWLYSFVNVPEQMSSMFFGLNLGEKSIFIAIIAGVMTFIQMKLSPSMKNLDPSEPQAKVSQMMLYSMPFMIALIGAGLPLSISIYFIANAIFTIIQDILFIKLDNKKAYEQSQ